MGCCSWPLSIIAWCMGEYSPKKYEEDSSDSDEYPVPRFRDLGVLKNRVTHNYELRQKKSVCYTEAEAETDVD